MRITLNIVLISVFVCMLVTPSVFSQQDMTTYSGNSRGVRILPQVGFNLTKLTDDPISTSEKFRLGIEAGLWVQTKNPIFFQPGLFFAQQRLDEINLDELEHNLTTDTTLQKVDYRCLKLPVMFGIQLWGARVYTGPSFTYIINIDESELTENEFKDLTMGLNIGAGLNITMFSFDVRYKYGITHILHENVAKANILTVSAGLKF
ncbi:MAG: porin family protein [Bacteroidales bacterium]